MLNALSSSIKISAEIVLNLLRHKLITSPFSADAPLALRGSLLCSVSPKEGKLLIGCYLYPAPPVKPGGMYVTTRRTARHRSGSDRKGARIEVLPDTIEFVY